MRAVVRVVVPAVVALACTACKQILGLHDLNGNGDASHPGDGTNDGSMGMPVCLGSVGWSVCVTAPSTPVVLPGDIDTDTATICLPAQPMTWQNAGQPDACFVVGATITTDVTVSAHGTRPLVLVASDSIVLGKLDVSSHVGVVGAGANSAACHAFVAMPQVGGGMGSGGGAGGSFMSAGGNGGTGGSGAACGVAPSPDAQPPLLHLRGGCAGQKGGDGIPAGSGGMPGDGGGATYLLAGNAIHISGYVDASGAGGRAGGITAGGGGGGTGGMIALSAPMIDVSGTLVANGGGGSSGSANTIGNPGSDPSATMPSVQASGGGSTGGSGAGGAGFAGSNNATAGANTANDGTGGGGGGGAAGYIRAFHAVTGGGTASPTIAVVP